MKNKLFALITIIFVVAVASYLYVRSSGRIDRSNVAGSLTSPQESRHEQAAIGDKHVSNTSEDERGATNHSFGDSMPGLPATSSNQISESPGTAADQPTSMDPQNRERIESYIESHIRSGSAISDYAELVKSEQSDPEWSRKLESLIDATIFANSKGLGGMQVAPTKCTRTVCMVAATSSNGRAPSSRDGWSRMPVILMNQPWFMANFHDSANSMSNDKSGNVYLIFMIRK